MDDLTSLMDSTATNGRPSSSPAPPNKTSNLTSALQGAEGRDRQAPIEMDVDGVGTNGWSGPLGAGRHDSFSGGMSGVGSQAAPGAKPISVKNPNRERPRRESVAGSMVGGMSWGGISVGSWIRDDIIMAGSSPFSYHQTPSYHSSSYLPKLEANFMRDFSCCGITLPSLHDLLQHYEECHAQQTAQPLPRSSQAGQSGQPTPGPSNKAAIAAGAVAAVQQQAQMAPRSSNRQDLTAHGNGPAMTGGPLSNGGMARFREPAQNQLGPFGRTPLPPVQDIEVVGDMDMDIDDEVNLREEDRRPRASQQQQQSQLHSLQQPALYQQNRSTLKPALPPLNVGGNNVVSPMQAHQGLRSSQSTTPSPSAHQNRSFQHNPTVSSVNTPTLSTQPSEQRQLQHNTFINHLSASRSRTPGGNPFDPTTSEMPTPVASYFPQSNSSFGLGPGSGYDMLDLCIDEPAKRLFSQNGSFANQQQYERFRLGGGQFGDERDINKKGKGQQKIGGSVENGGGMIMGDDPKPFRCPVVGCEKAYKNQNGLKYHKTHGHTNQRLHENADGTFSIVNPETSIPYPGTLGMEKEKPYGCETCGKRYKNLNGLKYHKAHSPPCNPEQRLIAAAAAATAAAGGGHLVPLTGCDNGGIMSGGGGGGGFVGAGLMPFGEDTLVQEKAF